MDLINKTVLVTGAFGTLGVAVVQTVRAAGAQVVALDRVAQAPAALSDIACFGGVDLLTPAAANLTFKSIAAKYNRIDAVVHVAGGFRWEKIEGSGIDTWDLLYNINLKTAVVTTQAALPHLRSDGGRLIYIGAAAAAKAGVGMGAYAASKSGVAKLTESLSEELKDRCITVNAVLPSIIDTPLNRTDMPDADFSRWVQPREIADVIAFLLSDKAGAITGALIPVCGRV